MKIWISVFAAGVFLGSALVQANQPRARTHAASRKSSTSTKADCGLCVYKDDFFDGGRNRCSDASDSVACENTFEVDPFFKGGQQSPCIWTGMGRCEIRWQLKCEDWLEVHGRHNEPAMTYKDAMDSLAKSPTELAQSPRSECKKVEIAYFGHGTSVEGAVKLIKVAKRTFPSAALIRETNEGCSVFENIIEETKPAIDYFQEKRASDDKTTYKMTASQATNDSWVYFGYAKPVTFVLESGKPTQMYLPQCKPNEGCAKHGETIICSNDGGKTVHNEVCCSDSRNEKDWRFGRKECNADETPPHD